MIDFSQDSTTLAPKPGSMCAYLKFASGVVESIRLHSEVMYRPIILETVPGTLVFPVGFIPPDRAIGLWIRLLAGDEGNRPVDMGSCFIPWCSVGGFQPGCGVNIKARSTSNGWEVRFRGSLRPESAQVCWVTA